MKLYYHHPEMALELLQNEDVLLAVSELGGDTEGVGDNTGDSSLDDVIYGGNMDW